MSGALDMEKRGQVLSQLASLLTRGVGLAEALDAISEELPARARIAVSRGVARAREGAALGVVLEQAGLVDQRDGALLAAASGEHAPAALALVAEELLARARFASGLRLLLVRPAWKLAGIFLLGVVVSLAVTLPGALLYEGAPYANLQFGFHTNWIGFPDIQGGSDLLLAQPIAQALLEATASLGSFAVLVFGLRQVARTRHGSLLLQRIGRRLPVASQIQKLDTSATFLRTLGTGLSSGLALPQALDRAKQALEGRLAAPEIANASKRATDGAPVDACLEGSSFVDETTAWLLQSAAMRPDLPREVLALARTYEERLHAEISRWAPLVGNLPELAVAIALWASLFGNGQIAAALRSMF